jgi:hypothetical protein
MIAALEPLHEELERVSSPLGTPNGLVVYPYTLGTPNCTGNFIHTSIWS